MSEAKTYKLKTIEDVFTKIPSDRIMDCMVEIGYSLAQAKHLDETAKEAGDDLGLQWPDYVEWMDDGKRECGYSISTPDGGYAEVINSELRCLKEPGDQGC